MECLHDERLEERSHAALICAVLANINRDPEHRPYDVKDFMPGAKSEEDELREFAEAVARGETFEDPPEVVAEFRRSLEANFSGIEKAKRGEPAEVIRTRTGEDPR